MKYSLPDGRSIRPNDMVHVDDGVDVEQKAAHRLPWSCTSPARAGSHVRLFKHVVYLRYLGKEKPHYVQGKTCSRDSAGPDPCGWTDVVMPVVPWVLRSRRVLTASR